VRSVVIAGTPDGRVLGGLLRVDGVAEIRREPEGTDSVSAYSPGEPWRERGARTSPSVTLETEDLTSSKPRRTHAERRGPRGNGRGPLCGALLHFTPSAVGGPSAARLRSVDLFRHARQRVWIETRSFSRSGVGPWPMDRGRGPRPRGRQPRHPRGRGQHQDSRDLRLRPQRPSRSATCSRSAGDPDVLGPSLDRDAGIRHHHRQFNDPPVRLVSLRRNSFAFFTACS
jgi:hypothetical protein